MSEQVSNWRVSRAVMDGFMPVMAPGGEIVCLISTLSSKCDEYAHLIAAAPALLKALEELVDGFPLPATTNEYELVQAGCDPTEAGKLAAAYAAIAKARGHD